MSACCAQGRNDKALLLLHRMTKEKVWPDQKTYTTLLRGAIKGGSGDAAMQVLDVALAQGPSRARRLLEDEMVQNVVFLLQRRKLMEKPQAVQIMEKLKECGFDLSTGGANTSTEKTGFGFGVGPRTAMERTGPRLRENRPTRQ
jgi:pentatricopeptide repeat protein